MQEKNVSPILSSCKRTNKGLTIESCSTVEVMICGFNSSKFNVFDLKHFMAVWITQLFDSLPPEVNIMSESIAFMQLATFLLASTMTSLAFLPKHL